MIPDKIQLCVITPLILNPEIIKTLFHLSDYENFNIETLNK